MNKELNKERWINMCYEVARENPEWIKITIEAFSAGVVAQAEYNKDKVANMGAALSAIYHDAKDKSNRRGGIMNKELIVELRELISHKIFGGAYYSLKGRDESDTKDLAKAIAKVVEIKLPEKREYDQKENNYNCYECGDTGFVKGYNEAIDEVKRLNKIGG